jgi:hypothetical protein
MAFPLLLFGILFSLVGILFIFFSNRFFRWFGKFSFENRLNYFAAKWKDQGLTVKNLNRKLIILNLTAFYGYCVYGVSE